MSRKAATEAPYNDRMRGEDPVRPVPIAARVQALEAILVDKGYVQTATLDAIVRTYEREVGPRNGARVVARAWVDSGYREWLLTDATAAIASLGYAGQQGEHMMALENTPDTHHLVVCTSCSCYPVAGSRAAAGLVQVASIPLARGPRSP